MAAQQKARHTSFLTETVLAVDLGSRSIKLVRLSRTFTSMQVNALIQAPAPADASSAATAAAVRKLIDAHNLQSQRIVVGVNGAAAFFRQLTFPFSKREKIEQVLSFELGALVPVDVESLSVDFMPMLSRETGKHRILASGLPKDLLTEWLEAFAEQDLHPEIIDLDLMGPWVLSRQFSGPIADNFCLADIGWSGMKLVFVSRGELVDLRIVPLGLRDLVQQLAAAQNSSPDQVEKVLSHADLNPLGDFGATKDAGKDTAETVHAMGSEIAQATFSLQMLHPDIEWQQILLCGGGALVPGMASALEIQLKTIVRPISDLSLKLQGVDDHPEAALFGPALGLAAQAARPRQGMNFRKGELARGRALGGKKEMIFAAALLLILFVGGAMLLGLEASMKSRRLSALEQRIETVFDRAVPDFAGTVRPSHYPSILKARIMALSGGAGANSEPAASPLEILLGVSQSLSGGLKITVRDITIDPESVRLNGTAEAFNTINDAKTRLSELDTVSEVKILGAKADAGGKGINFSMQLLRKSGSRS